MTELAEYTECMVSRMVHESRSIEQPARTQRTTRVAGAKSWECTFKRPLANMRNISSNGMLSLIHLIITDIEGYAKTDAHRSRKLQTRLQASADASFQSDCLMSKKLCGAPG